jgi:hypothetical protein
MLFSRKKLYERDPATLSYEHLSILHGALMAKLLLVTKELGKRCEALAEAAEGIPNAADSQSTFAFAAKRYRGLALILDNVLAQQLGKTPEISN